MNHVVGVILIGVVALAVLIGLLLYIANKD